MRAHDEGKQARRSESGWRMGSDVLGDLAEQGFGIAWLPDSSFQRGRREELVAVGEGEWDMEVSIVAYRAQANSRRSVSEVWGRLVAMRPSPGEFEGANE